MILKQEVENIAKLARLGLTEEEKENFGRELSSILDYIEKLKKASVNKVEPTSRSFLLENVMRKDRENPACGSSISILLGMFPETKNGFLKTKPILQ